MKAKKTILIVDDDAELAGAMRTSFRRRGYRVVSCSNTEGALVVARELAPDMAVVDLNLGGGSNGLACLRALKVQAPDMAAILLTGYASVATAVEAIKFGARQYLCKPASISDILVALGECVDAEISPVRLSRKRSVLKAEELKGIKNVMELTGGNVSEAARRLGLHRRSLQRKLQMLSMPD